MREYLSKHKKYILKSLGCAFLIGLMLLPVTSVYANDWVEKSTIPYGGSSVSDVSDMGSSDEEEKDSVLESFFAGLLAKLARQINSVMSNSDVNMSIDGIVLGRMANNTDVAYSQFDLSQGNPWGIIGAYMYRFFRTAIYSVFIIYFVVQVGFAMRKRTVAKDRAEFKEFLFNVAFFFVLLSAFPKFVDFVLYGRDCLMYAAIKSIGGTSGLGVGTSAGVGIVGAFKGAYEAKQTIFNSILFLASSCAGVFFFMDYIATALIQMGLFGGSGWVFLRSTKDKKLLSSWASTFFPNMCIPLIDTLLLLAPLAVQAIYQANVGNADSIPLAIRLIQLVCIWSIIPTRNAIMRFVLGSMGMAANRSGLGGLLALGSAAVSALSGAMRGISRRGSRSDSGSDSGSVRNDASMAQESREQSEIFDEANRRTRDGMSDVSDILGEKQEHADIGGIGDEYRSMGDYDEDTELQNILDGDSGMGYDAAGGIMTEPSETLGGESGVGRMTESSETLEGEMGTDSETIGGSIDNSSMDERALNDNEMIGSVDDISPSSAMPSDVTEMAGTGEYANIPNMNSEFANSLSENEKDRYANLNARDALRGKLASNSDRLGYINEQMSNDQDYLSKLKSDGAELSAELSPKIESRNNSISQLENRNRSIDNQINELRGQSDSQAKIQALQEERSSNSATIASARQEISGYNQQLEANKSAQIAKSNDIKAWRQEATAIQQHNQRLQSGIEKCTNREKQYAQNYADAGMSNRVYASAENFKTTKSAERNLEKHMNYKNFDSGRFDAILTPQQKAEMYHQRAVRGAIKKAAVTTVSTAATVGAGAAGAAVTASMATFGGPGAMASAGVAGGMAGGAVGSMGAKAAVGGLEAISNPPDTARELGITASRGAEKVSSGVKKAYSKVTKSQIKTPRTTGTQSKKVSSKTSSSREMRNDFKKYDNANVKLFEEHQEKRNEKTV